MKDPGPILRSPSYGGLTQARMTIKRNVSSAKNHHKITTNLVMCYFRVIKRFLDFTRDDKNQNNHQPAQYQTNRKLLNHNFSGMPVRAKPKQKTHQK